MIKLKSAFLKLRGFAFLVLAGLLFIAQPAVAATDTAADWQFTTSVYMWAPSIMGESAAGGDIDISFDTILENLDLTFMGSFGARKGKWGFLTDVIYMDLEDDDNSPLGPLGFLTLDDVELKAWIVTPMLTYEVLQSERFQLNVLAGARYLYMKADLTIDKKPPLSPPTTETFSDHGEVLDGIVGVNGHVNLTQNWYLPFHFDVGSGDTDLTWQAYGGVGYKFKNFDLIAAYRHLRWEFDDDDKGGGTFNDLYITGPMLGIKFVF